jgi:hypothetical protein
VQTERVGDTPVIRYVIEGKRPGGVPGDRPRDAAGAGEAMAALATLATLEDHPERNREAERADAASLPLDQFAEAVRSYEKERARGLFVPEEWGEAL